jgi:hypothetical protein
MLLRQIVKAVLFVAMVGLFVLGTIIYHSYWGVVVVVAFGAVLLILHLHWQDNPAEKPHTICFCDDCQYQFPESMARIDTLNCQDFPVIRCPKCGSGKVKIMLG